MGTSRRAFLAASAGWTAGVVLPERGHADPIDFRQSDASTRPAAPPAPPGTSYDPWLELDASALRDNVAELGRMSGGRPLIAVVKNNAYGLGVANVGRVLDGLGGVDALAVVKAEEAFALRDAGVVKPVLLLGPVEVAEGVDLVRRDVRLAPFTEDASSLLAEIGRGAQRPVPVHLYLDTGMSRLGMPYHRAGDWMRALAAREDVRIEGVFTTFTEDDEFDAEQLARFVSVVEGVRGAGVRLGVAHAASSHALFFRPDAYLDTVRPGLAVYGAYPAGAADLGRARLRPAFRLCARVARVERLREGDSVSYGRNYVAARPTWIATLTAGHADGYPRRAVDGCEVLIDGRTYRVIGAVSASHTIVELGDQRSVEPGAIATLVGPDHPAILPNAVAERAGVSVYDVLMHLSARLPVRAVQ